MLARRDSVQRFQELAHPAGHDYRAGSPHLKHHHLNDWLVEMVRQALADVVARGLPATILEVGAGHGSFVEPTLAMGCRVTATEMSRPSVNLLRERYGANPSFAAYYDEDGSLSVLGGQRFSLILYASVLHHIPDYRAAIAGVMENHLAPGGALVTFQDPLWYPSLERGTQTVSRLAYLWWRLPRGNYRRGFSTTGRRLQHQYDEANPSDMVEYHVIRNGVDQRAIHRLLANRFESVTMESYWSTQSDLWQRLGEKLNRRNTFAVIALDYQG